MAPEMPIIAGEVGEERDRAWAATKQSGRLLNIALLCGMSGRES